VQCHGSDARGSKGFPNLADADWLHGGDGASIVRTISAGRNGMMPPMAAAVGSAADIENLANYVLSMSGSAHDAVKAELGKPKFAACAGCHGADGKGNTAVGAPSLTDKVWLYGGSHGIIFKAIGRSRTSSLPSCASQTPTSRPTLHRAAQTPRPALRSSKTSSPRGPMRRRRRRVGARLQRLARPRPSARRRSSVFVANCGRPHSLTRPPSLNAP
jgi:mono/diheme cytochrome c family protein